MMFNNLRRSNKLLPKLIVFRDPIAKGQRNLCQKIDTENAPVYPRRIFSGIQPTGSVHLGNYLGAIKEWVRLQNSGEDVIWSIVDMHSITLSQNPEELQRTMFDLTATLLACGIDPERSILFQQSTVPMHAELCWILACITTMPRLAQLPQFKEKSENLKNIPLGLYIYPILQSADILLYKATHVPVGEDQLQHLQLAQHLANLFNNKFGNTFPLPHSIINDTSGRIKSLKDPTKKMSKSCDSARSKIILIDTPDIILRKIKRSVTDFTSEVTYEPATRPGVANLITLHSLSSGKSPQNICKESEGMDTGQYKYVVANALIEHLEPIRRKYLELKEEPDYLENVLKNGTRKALEIANQHWPDIREKIGFGNGSFNMMAAANELKVKS